MSAAAPEGLLVVDKPQGMTSHDVVSKARRALGTKKVGHAGTLDPMATGVLILGVGRATKLLTYITGHSKDYSATIRLGQATVTDDAEGDVTYSAVTDAVTDEAIRGAAAALVGDILQRPSSVSAIKINGVRSYTRVRSGEEVELPARPVTVYELTIQEIRRLEAQDGSAVIDVDVYASVSSGTYIRALARDIGAELGVGGHLTALRRVSVGEVTLDGAVTLDELAERGTESLHALESSAKKVLPWLTCTRDQARDLGYGKWVALTSATQNTVANQASMNHEGSDAQSTAQDTAVFTESGVLVAIVRPSGKKVKPVVGFMTPDSAQWPV